MMKSENGEIFQVEIPEFTMEVPYMLNWSEKRIVTSE
jgi:uncharacterized protein affecting Mg2+/Co2+ transport